MYAIVRRYAYDPAAIASAGQALAAAQELHTTQPGYAGSIVVNDGQHFIAVNLWQSEHHAAAGRAVIGTRVQRLLEPLMATPSQLLGAGEVVATDLADHMGRHRHPLNGRARRRTPPSRELPAATPQQGRSTRPWPSRSNGGRCTAARPTPGAARPRERPGA
jgi:hypothetical protein